MRVNVWLDAGRDGQTFTYRADATLAPMPGDLVRVRLRGRPMHGLVVQPSTELDGAAGETTALQPIEEIVQRAAVDPDWREWIEASAQRCYLSPFRMLKAALPPGWLGQARSAALRSGRWQCWVSLSPDYPDATSLTSKQRALIEQLRDHPEGLWQGDLTALGFSADLIRRLALKGCLTREQRRRETGEVATFSASEAPRELTEEQQQAVELFEALEPGEGLLLWGITGSGKTEVYLQLAAAELQAGRHVLLMTPEIGLIPQLVDRCRRRFGHRVLEYHSGCLLYTSPSPRDLSTSRMPSSA